jgi:hypothetical protein
MQFSKFLFACLLAYAVLTALLIVTVPINKAPDEGAHLEYAQYLAQKKSFPVFKPLGANAPGYEFHQPPLYYVLVAPSYAISENAAPYLARMISLLCSILTLVFLWNALRLLFPGDELLANLTTGFAAIWPLHVAVGASAGNDALAGAMCAGMFWSVARLAARLSRREYSWRDAALIGIFFGLGMLSKSTALVVGIAALGATFHLLRRAERESGERAGSTPIVATSVVLGFAILLCGGWLMHNTVLYGDPLAAKIFDEAFANSPSRREFLQTATGAFGWEYLRAWFTICFATCWGFFGGPNTAIAMLNLFGSRGPRFEAFSVLPVMFFPLAATVVALFGFAKWKWRELRTPLLPPLSRIALLWWGVALLLAVVVLFRFNLTYFQAQARYLHPALLPMALVFALGWREVFGAGRALRAFSIGFGAILILLTLWNAFGWKTLV